MSNTLSLPESMAIEFKYLGNSYPEISRKLNKPEETIAGWFKSDGKLYVAYNEYAEMMNKQRQKNLEDEIAISDKEFFVITSNVVKSIGRSMQDREVPLLTEEGHAVLLPDGKVRTVVVPSKTDFTVNDLKIVWQIQRLMKGLPINYEKQDIEQTNFEADMVIKELGLTDADFEDERLNETTTRINEYLRIGKR